MFCEVESRFLGGMYAFLLIGTWESLEDHCHHFMFKRDSFFFSVCSSVGKDFAWEPGKRRAFYSRCFWKSFGIWGDRKGPAVQ